MAIDLLATIQNLGLLASLSLVYEYLYRRPEGFPLFPRQIVAGFAITALAITMQQSPISTEISVISDARFALFLLTGLFFGALSTLTAFFGIELFAMATGSQDLISSIVILAGATSGIVWRQTIPSREPKWHELLMGTLTAQVVITLTVIAATGTIAVSAILALSPAILFFFPVIATLTGSALGNRQQDKRRHKENQLRESRKNLAMSASGIGLTELDLGSRDYVFNDGFASLLGFDPEEFRKLQAPLTARLHPADAPKIQKEVEKYLAESSPENPGELKIEARLRHRNGDWIWIKGTLRAIEWNMQGAPVRILGSSINVSDHKAQQAAIQSENARKSQLLKKSHRGISDLQKALEQRKQAEQALLLREKLLNQMGHVALVGGWRLEVATGATLFTPQINQIFETSGEKLVCFDDLRNFVSTEDWQRLAESLEICIKRGKSFDLCLTISTIKQNKKWLRIIGQGDYSDGNSFGVIGAIKDITRYKTNEEAMTLASLVYQHSSEAMMVLDADSNILDVNPAFTRIVGYDLDEMEGKKHAAVFGLGTNVELIENVSEELQTIGYWNGERVRSRKNGEVFTSSTIINAIKGQDGEIDRILVQFSDISERKQAEQLIWQQANFDALTGLPNRRMFHDRLTQELKKSHRFGVHLGLLFIDLDHFKEVNDTLGHEQGDILLNEAAKRLTNSVRETDTVARLGGDEFVVILSELNEVSMVEQIAEDIIYRLDQPYRLQDETAFVTASVGIAIYPDDGRTAGDLLKCADQAMYAAKNGGRNGYQYFTRSMQESVDSRMRMISDIRHALHDGQMWVAYQPVIDLHADRVSKAEVVLRWTHPQRGNIATADFIPVAEESGLINDIGEFVLSQAARQAAQWRKQSHPDFQISINVSAMQLRNSHRSVFQEWSEQLNKYQLDPSALALEINEQSLADIHPAAIDQLRLLRSAGTKIYVDDFGTGYSQLAHLRNLKVDYLKIDHSFVKGLATDNEDMALCEGIILMAHKLGMKVVAEGVETHEQRRLLTGAGCDFAQGFLYSEPVPADKFEIRSKGVPLQLLAN